MNHVGSWAKAYTYLRKLVLIKVSDERSKEKRARTHALKSKVYNVTDTPENSQKRATLERKSFVLPSAVQQPA